MHDYVYPSVFFCYLVFFLCLAGAIFFFLRSRHDGYWGKQSEDPKYQMLADDDDQELLAKERRPQYGTDQRA